MEKRNVNTSVRWIHLYLSMFSFGALMFFAVTGITLNHPSWAEKQQKIEILKGNIDPSWVKGNDTMSVVKPEIVEYFTKQNRVRGLLTEFRIEDSMCSLSFTGPGYNAYCIIERATGSYELIVTNAGFIAIMNDLHKGSDTGKTWNAIIDITAIIFIVVSLTGFIMIFFIAKKRSKGLIFSLLGAITFFVLCMIFV